MKKYFYVLVITLMLIACGNKNLPTCEDEGVKKTISELFLNENEPVYKSYLKVTFDAISDEGKTELSNNCKARVKVKISEEAEGTYEKFNKSAESKYARAFAQIINNSIDYSINYSIKKNKIDERFIIEMISSAASSKNKLDYSSLEILDKPDQYVQQLEKLHAVDKFEEWLKSSNRNGEEVSKYIEKNNLITVKKCGIVMRGVAEKFEISCYVGNEFLTVTTMHTWIMGKLNLFNVGPYVAENWGMNLACMNSSGNTASTDEAKLVKIFVESQDSISFVKTNDANSVNLVLTGCRI